MASILVVGHLLSSLRRSWISFHLVEGFHEREYNHNCSERCPPCPLALWILLAMRIAPCAPPLPCTSTRMLLHSVLMSFLYFFVHLTSSWGWAAFSCAAPPDPKTVCIQKIVSHCVRRRPALCAAGFGDQLYRLSHANISNACAC